MGTRLSKYLFLAALALPVFGQVPRTRTDLPSDGVNGANGLAKIDCNGDGITDLVATNRIASYSVFIGNGDGTFQTPRTFPLAGVAFAGNGIGVGDLNGDGKPDLAFLVGSNIIPALGSGSCTFTFLPGFSVGNNPAGITIADVTNDGKNDIISNDSNTIKVFPGNGSGGFGSVITSTVGTAPNGFALADMNGDGKQDIITADNSSNGIFVAIGDNTGHFINPFNLTVGSGPQTPAVGDINGDGKPDLAVSQFLNNRVAVIINTTTPGGPVSFLPPYQIVLPGGTGPTIPSLITTPGGDKQDNLIVPGFNLNNLTEVPNLAKAIFQSIGLGLPFNPAGTIYPTGFDPTTVLTIPLAGGATLAAPTYSGVTTVTPNCTVAISPDANAGALRFGKNPPVLIPGLEVEVTVPDGCPWSAAVTFNGNPVDYATVTPSSGVGPATVLVQMTSNTGDARGARITFTSGKNSKFAFAYQSAGNATCTPPVVDKTAAAVPATGGTTSIGVTVSPSSDDACAAGAGTTNPSVTVSPAGLVTTTGPVVLTIPPNAGDTYTFYALVGNNNIPITVGGTCIPVIGGYSGSVPATGGIFVLPYTVQQGCTTTPKPSGLGATTTQQVMDQALEPAISSGKTSERAAVTAFNVQVSVPATTATSPLTGTVTIGSQVAHFVQKPQNPTQLFNDVPLTHGLVDWITMLKKLGITAGCTTTNYCPDDPVTRGQMAVFIVRSLESGDNFPYNATQYFTDVPPAHPFFKYIQRMKDLGITAGCGGTNYCPDDGVTRGQMGVFLIRGRFGIGAGISVPYPGDQYFSDEPSSDGFYPYIQNMKALGITSGCSATAYCPSTTVTRGQMAVFLIRNFFTPFAK